MRIGLVLDDQGVPFAEVVEQARSAAQQGFSGVWVGEHFGWDPLTALTVVGREVPGVELGTAIVATYSRHPLALASQALTAQATTGGRLTLGVGPSHRAIVEGRLGRSYDRPARHVRDYLEALGPMLRGDGIAVPAVPPPSVLVSALGPTMLRIAGELAEGTVTVWAGAETLADHVVPAISRAASAAGRPRPRVVAMLPVVVTDAADAARDRLAELFAPAADLPAYRAVLDRGGAAGPADAALVGDETRVVADVRRLADAGATDLLVPLTGSAEERRRTTEVLGSLG